MWLSGNKVVAVVILGAGAIVLAPGCASYRAQPLDDAAHLAEWRARQASSPPVAALSERLGRAGDGGGPFDAADGLSLREAEAVALVFNPELRLARAKARVSAAEAANAGRWEDPVLAVDIARITSATAEPWKIMGSIGFTLPVSGRLKAERARAGAASDTDLARIVEAEWKVRTELRRRWVEWSGDRERAAVLAESVGSLRTLVDTVGRIEAAGEVARVEARLFRLDLLELETRLARVQGGAAAGEVAIRRLLGLAPEAELTLVASLHRPEPGMDALRDSNPSLGVARSEYEESERQLALEVRRQYPDVTVGPGVGRDEGMDEVLLGISLPIPAWNRNKAGVARAFAARDAARVGYEAAVERLTWNLAAARVQRRTVTAQRDAIARGLVPMTDEQYADARRLSELGEVNTLLILESLSRHRGTKLALIDAAVEEALAAVTVEEILGPPAPIDGGNP